jgi:CSLREA domain-containing protein
MSDWSKLAVKAGKSWLGLLILLALVGSLQAAVIVVDTIEDGVAEDGLCSLREAILNANGANQSGSSDCVAGDVAGNRIHFDTALTGQTIVLNGTPLPAITRPLIIAGPAVNDWNGLTIDGNDAVRIFQFDAGFNSSFSAAISALTLRNGRTDALNQPGGGLWLRNVDLEMRHVQLLDNRTTGPSSMAGGMWISGGHVQLIDSRIVGNVAQNAGGGLMISNGELEMLRTTVADNQATSGGGIRAVDRDHPEQHDLRQYRRDGRWRHVHQPQ